MAEIQQPPGSRHTGVRRSKKLSTKVDLTPMVDLGFLLITFFVFTTSIATPTAMQLHLPADGIGAESAAGKTISLLLAGHNKVFYYNGDSIGNMQITGFQPLGLRQVIINKKNDVQRYYGDERETVVLIKPTEEATYSNIVDALDEMQINGITRYVLMDPEAPELVFLKDEVNN